MSDKKKSTKHTVKKVAKIKTTPRSYHINSFLFLLFMLGLFSVGLVVLY